MLKFSNDKKIAINFVKEGPLKVFLVSLIIVIVTAGSHFFVLAIFFDKYPPVSVGIPYSIYSFSTGKLILIGLIYDCVFFVGTNIFIKTIRNRV